MSDPYAAFASPVSGNEDPYAQIAAPVNSAPRGRKTPRLASAAIGAADVGLAGLADEIAARTEAAARAIKTGDMPTLASKALGVLTAPGRAIYQAVGVKDPTFTQDFSDDPREAARRQELRGVNAQAMADNPVSYLGGGLAGGLATAPLYGGASAPVARTLGQRAMAGASAGAVQGAAYGYGSGQGDQRMQSAVGGMALGGAVGGAVGAAAPVVSNAVRAAGRAADAFIPEPGTMTTSAMVGGLPRAGGGGGRSVPPRARDPVSEQLAKLAEREGVTPEQLDEMLKQAAADPRGRVMADLLGENAVTRAGTLAELPGRTKPLAQRTMEARTSGQLERLQRDVDAVAGGQSVAQSAEDIAAQFKQASETLYQPALARPINPAAVPRLEAIMRRLPPRVTERVATLIDDLARYDGVDPQSFTPAQRIHYIKMALDASIDGMKREGLDSVSLRGLTRLKRDFLTAIEGDEAAGIPAAIPGYKQARMTWGGISEAQDALETGQKVFAGTQGAAADAAPDMIAADVRNYSEAAKAMFEVGVRSAVRGLLQSADKGGASNVAAVFRSTARRNILRSALGRERADKLIAAMDEEIRLFKSAGEMTPGRNSQTFRRAADAADMMASEMPLNPRSAVDMFLGRITDPVRQGIRNRMGEALYTPADPYLPGYDPKQNEAILAAIRARLARQQAATATARATGRAAGGASGSGNNR